MRQGIFEIQSNRALTQSVCEMKLRGDCSAFAAPGQFAQIQLPGLYLRRPISVCDAEGDILTLVYKRVGRGTEAMAKLLPGAKLDLLTGLGNGFDLAPAGSSPLIISGGVGAAPLYGLAKRLHRAKNHVTAILGFNSASEVFYEEEFRALGIEVIVTTADGSCGIKGFAADAVPASYSYVYACGPEPMLKAVYAATAGSGQYSFEERMGCGFGACMGCTRQTKGGPKRVCADGPVFRREEIVW